MMPLSDVISPDFIALAGSRIYIYTGDRTAAGLVLRLMMFMLI